jgi:hypothetical protein
MYVYDHFSPALGDFAYQIPGTNPIVRKEWRQLNEAEKLNYVESVQCLGKSPSKLGLNTTRYEDFVWFHLQAYLNCE